MANGSFGLSGLPTAPTTVGSAPNNPFTPVSVAVNSTAGFQAGDLIYNRNGDFSTPVSATGTATFPITSTEPTMNSATGSWLTTPTTASGSASVINNNGVVMGYTYAATLTSGNIVFCYRSTDGTVRFKIVDENYATIVSEVTTTFTARNYALVGVTALTGGGFVIYSTEGSSNFEFAIYSNAGVVVTARTVDTTYIFNSYFLNVVARPDGSWIVYGTESSAVCVYKVYSATGVQVYAWTSIGTSNSSGGQWTISVRSDNSFVLVFPNTGTNMITYAVRSATNTVTVAPTSTTVTLTSNGPLTSVCLSNNDVVFIYAVSSGSAITARKLTSANSLGTAVSVYPSTTNFYNDTNHLDAYVLPSDNYLIAFPNQFGSTRYYTTNNYLVVNSSGAIISGTNPIRLFNTQAYTGFQAFNVIVRTTNYIHHINYLSQTGGITSSLSSQPTTTIGTRISPTTYQIVPNQSVSVQVGNTAVQPVSAYAPIVSSPSAAGYYATTSGTITTSVAATTGAITGTQIEAFTADTMDACPLTGGGVAILYFQLSTGTVKVAIYNVSMVLQTTISFTTGYTAQLSAAYRVAQLTNGKLVVSYQTGTSSYSYNVYSTSYALLTTFAAPGGLFTANNLTDTLSIIPLSGARFAVVYKVSNNPTYIVHSDSGTVLVANTTIVGLGFSSLTASSTPSGFNVFGFYPGGAQSRAYTLFETVDQSNSFSISGAYTTTTTIAALDLKAVTSVNGACIFPFVTANTQMTAYWSQTSRGTPNSATGVFNNNVLTITNNFSTNSIAVVGAPCIGGAVHGALDYVAKTFVYFYAAGALLGNGGASTTLTFTNNDLASTSPSTLGGARLVGLYGSIMVFTYINSAKYPTYALINIDPASYDTTLVAGATPSNATQSLSTATGYSLVGVSSTAAPANGQGTVVINGPAQLNSNYSASTPGQSFDFGNPVTFGAAGTISGRNVNLIGNV